MRPFSQSTLNLQKVAGVASASSALTSEELAKIIISGLTHSDSQIEPGDLFIAMPGANRHGAEFSKLSLIHI
jgi:UDP-N-acetylmuramoyl-L-alanyl-D-glutamate--2,6-diaminopimelate ligase